ncbi:histidine ammonia-lyase [Nordella sp. HKS 07]|uniref:histidine ammonia-lyase n=1 Tax=Nordella sp. HKS 07 TaxID=2712222 RepID=UPI0013E13287|nr:histidine ammonia-lyase [Nordella sp. HKS 07]QIG49065.1 histidine ammonia-lyase [Nordella sp. HKS 07]
MLLKPGTLTLKDLRDFSAQDMELELAPADRQRMAQSRQVVEDRIAQGITTYGVNTGFGTLSGHLISARDLDELQRRLIVSNAAGTGEFMGRNDVRRMMLLKASALATGRSGARPQLAEAILALLNHDITPCVPSKGSVGASGDLAPLAHMGAALIGTGDVLHAGCIVSATAALEAAGLKPFKFAAKEGLSIVNGTQASTSFAVAGLFRAEELLAAALVAGALSVEAAHGQDMAFDARLHQARGQPGQIAVAGMLRMLLAESGIRVDARVNGRLQDPYCLRCQPQVMGACLDQLRHAATVIGHEINAWTDNPMVDAESGDILYGGNFHAEPVGMAADMIAVALAEIGAMSERRIAMLTDPHHSRLPAFLVKETGLDSGFMVAQVTAAALASENKSLAHPASVDSIPTTANHEDFVSMATFAARRLADMADNVAAILAIELLAACQGLEFRRPARSSKLLEDIHARIRRLVPAYEEDRFFAPDIAAVKDLVLSGAFLAMLPPDLALSSASSCP